MATLLVRLKPDCWILFSTVSDAPETFGLTWKELMAECKDRWGREGMWDIERREASILEKGTSVRRDECPHVTVSLNRAGHREERLEWPELVEWYGEKKQEPPPGIGFKDEGDDSPEPLAHENPCPYCLEEAKAKEPSTAGKEQ